MSNKYAPVLIPTLNRYDHFSKCIESLAQCVDSDKTDLFIALDYPTKESHWEGYKKIEKICSQISGFKSVNILKRETNLGAISNFTATTTTLRCSRRSFAIVSHRTTPSNLASTGL